MAKKKFKKRAAKVFKNFKAATTFGLVSVFGWFTVRGILELIPNIAGWTMLTVGIIGLSIMGYLGFKKF